MWSYAIDHPVKAGLAVGITGAAAAAPATAAVAGVVTIQPGVSIAYVGKMIVGSALYGYVTKNALGALPGMVQSYSQFNVDNARTWAAPTLNTGLMYGPDAIGERVGAVYNIGDSINHAGNSLSEKKETERH